jgi:hypothetical protein
MMIPSALASGLVGATALTILHETTRRNVRHAPRMDVLGERAIAGALHSMGMRAPQGAALHQTALAGDVLSNSMYYSLVGLGSAAEAPANGALLGLLAGVGAVVLPGPLGLGTKPSRRTSATAAMTVGMYLAGGLAAGITYCVAASQQRTSAR